MVVAVLLTGIIWGLDVWLWAPKRRLQLKENSGGEFATSEQDQTLKDQRHYKEPVIVEYSRSLFPVILIVLLLRSFLVEPFRIPSGSMMPTLLDGDFILVNKYTYGIRLPVINSKILSIGSPKRGDVAVFRYPVNPKVDFIKRVIGLPGDHIEYRNNTLYVNGKAIEQLDNGVYDATGAGITMAGAELLEENLTGVKHKILKVKGQPQQYMQYADYTVREHEYFMMGDNRDNSNDSRFWGPVPEANLVGRAFMIWMNWDSTNGGVTWSRIGNSIH